MDVCFPGKRAPAAREAARALLRRAECGAGGVVLVDGDTGIGKSLLLRGGVDDAAGRGFSLAVGAAAKLERTVPFSALRDAMPELFAAAADGDDTGSGLAGAMERWTACVRGLLEQRSVAGPVLVCLDDLQWACPGTLAIVRVLSRDLRRDRVAWLLARSGPAGPAARAFHLLEAEGAVRVTLGPLDADAVTDMLADAFGAPPDEGLADLARGAAGNPSLIAELVSGLREGGAVHVAGGRAVLASDKLPKEVTGLARRWLGNLSGPARHLVMTAAVLDPESRIEDAAGMLAETPATLLPAVGEAVEAGIMTAGELTFAFRHPLLRRAVAEMIPGPARQALHRQYGEILLTRTESAGRAAGHLLRAAHPADPASVAGLDRAAARVALVSLGAAADLAARALELTPQAGPNAVPRGVTAAEMLAAAGRPEDAGRVARGMLARPVPAVAEGRLRCVLSSVLCTTGRAREAAVLAQLVLARPDLPGDVRDQALIARLTALAGLRDPLAGPVADRVLAAPGRHGTQARAAALAARALADLNGGRIGDGIGSLRKAARDGGASPDARHVQSALLLAAALIDLRLLQEAEDVLRTVDGQKLDSAQARAALSLLRARAQLAAGRVGEAAAGAQAARALAGSVGADGLASAACCVLAAAALRRGDVAAADRHLAARPVTGPQFADLYARAETVLAAVQVSEAREGPEAVLESIRGLCAGLEEQPGPVLGDPAVAAWLARTAVAGGDRALGVRVSDAATALAEGWPAFPALAAAADHARGVAYDDPGALAGAAAGQHDLWARASAAEDLAVLHARVGARQDAVGRLKDALAGYGQAGADRDQARVRRRLRTLGVRCRHWAGPARGPVTGWHALTATEQAVARLVAEGLSNGQVGARMYISTHTVAHHLRQSYRKLAISSRVELTRVVLKQAGASTD